MSCLKFLIITIFLLAFSNAEEHLATAGLPETTKISPQNDLKIKAPPELPKTNEAKALLKEPLELQKTNEAKALLKEPLEFHKTIEGKALLQEPLELQKTNEAKALLKKPLELHKTIEPKDLLKEPLELQKTNKAKALLQEPLELPKTIEGKALLQEPSEPRMIHEPANLTKLDGRIVGGVEVRIEDIPYQVSVQYTWRHMCGGALIASKFVITAAHCTDGIHDPNLLKVRAGSSLHNSGGVMRSVSRINQDPRFNSVNIDYDISILELQSPIYYWKTTRPIPLIESGATLPNGLPAIVSGWGYLTEDGEGPHKLHAVSIPIVSRERCAYSYGQGAITERMICAGIVDEGGKDACQGDSGGPLVADGKLIGIVSWGYGCARPRFPGVYTNVAGVRDYIDSIYK